MAPLNPAARLVPRRNRFSELILTTGFILTGAGTVLLGSQLPRISQMWALDDNAAGLLLFLQFFGSALGAVFTGLNRRRSMAAGYGLLAASALALAFSTSRTLFPAFFFFGLGLGLAMTSTSLTFSDRFAEDRAAKLEGINFAWSLGACTGPVFFLVVLRRGNLQPLFLTLLGMFLFLLAWVLLVERDLRPASDPDAASPPSSVTRLSFLSLALLAMCTVGIEASLSGWLTTYSHRAGLKSLAGAAMATTIFWCGGMLSRLAFSTRLMAKVGRHAALLGSIYGVALFVFALVAAQHPLQILVIAGLAGFCIGPIYPLTLSFLLERTARGWVFAVAGVGAAFFPWITGMISTASGSLRLGLVTPCLASLLMLVLRFWSFPTPGSSGAAARSGRCG
jgi:FHS family glucose/mannose:H+ symporter-like MFS transporter